MEKPRKEPVGERGSLAPLTRGPHYIGPGPPQLCNHLHDDVRLILQVGRDDANHISSREADAAAHGNMGTHVARQPDTPHPEIILCNPGDYMRRAIAGMIVDNDHFPIEILARKCLAHRFIERYEVIRLVEGGNDETKKRRHPRVVNHELVPSFYCVMNFCAATVLSLSIAAWRWPQAFDCRGGASVSVVGRSSTIFGAAIAPRPTARSWCSVVRGTT